MSEQRQHNGFVPLRVRFRAHGEQTHVAGERLQWQRGHVKTMHTVGGEAKAQAPIIQIPTESQQHTRQVKELLRLGNMLRAELGLDEVLQHIAASINTCTGFRASVIKLLEEGSEHLKAVAFAGVAEEDERMLREHPMRVEQMLRQMQPDFRISQSYFISHEHIHLFADVPMVGNIPLDDYEPGGWHPMDMLIVPLYSPRQKKLVGFLSLDDPEDKKVPTLERIEVVELFAQQAALAIDNARIFQEREAEHQALEEGISSLTQDLEQMQRGDLRVRVRPSHEKLQPIADAVNSMVEEISGILADVQVVTRAVDDHTHDVQRSSDLLVRDADHQERQVFHVSHEIDEMATMMRLLAEHAAKLSQIASEAVDVTSKGQDTVDRAVDGIRRVRETTMQSARMMRRLSESGQEVNDTVVSITDLTTSMNLLALNAAIEAVRASEYGQGFAVIAQEIRALAVHSSEAARKVATHIRTVQHETTAISQSVERNTQQVVVQTDLVTQTGVELDAINVVTEQIVDLVKNIRDDAERQGKSSQMAVSSVEEISRMTSEITAHMRQMQQSLQHLVEMTDSLRSRLAVFRIAER